MYINIFQARAHFFNEPLCEHFLSFQLFLLSLDKSSSNCPIRLLHVAAKASGVI